MVDQNGNFVVSAAVRLAREGHAAEQEITSNQEGHFPSRMSRPGPFQLTIYGPQVLRPGRYREFSIREKRLEMLELRLSIAAATTEVQVRRSTYELAEEQIKVQETQRVLGVIPNFYVTYDPDGAAA